jgi:hypothetical protein
MTAFDSIDCFNVPSKLSSQITEYLEQQPLILEYLKKARAKAQIALSDELLDFDLEVIHHYLWSLSDRLEITMSMFENLMDVFFKIRDKLTLIS